MGLEPPRGRLRELLAVFGTPGVIGFGGPAAHIAIVVSALFAFARSALTDPLRMVVARGTGLLWIVGVNELVLLAGGTILVAGARLGTSHPWAVVGLVRASVLNTRLMLR